MSAFAEQEDVWEILARDQLSLNDVKTVMRHARHTRGNDQRIDYANSLLAEAGDYLPTHILAAFVRADITVEQADDALKRNKAFFSRLVDLLPSILSFLSNDELRRNPQGVLSTIDDCHSDFHLTLISSRKDRQLREAKEKLASARRLADEAASALSAAEQHFKHEYDGYRSAYYLPSPGPSRFLSDLVEELRVCAGVLEIVHVVADLKPDRIFVHGNDARGSFVEWTHHICSMWGGPRLVTTPGSDFSVLCSLLFEAVSGQADEGLSGAIIRYARSESRKQWDQDGEDGNEDDNFQSLKGTMSVSSREALFCRDLLRGGGLSDMAKVLLLQRIAQEEKRYEVASKTYGPRQIYISQLNDDQFEDMILDAISKLKPEKMKLLEERLSSGMSSAARDIEIGQTRRSVEGQIDV